MNEAAWRTLTRFVLALGLFDSFYLKLPPLTIKFKARQMKDKANGTLRRAKPRQRPGQSGQPLNCVKSTRVNQKSRQSKQSRMRPKAARARATLLPQIRSRPRPQPRCRHHSTAGPNQGRRALCLLLLRWWHRHRHCAGQRRSSAEHRRPATATSTPICTRHGQGWSTTPSTSTSTGIGG